MQLSILILQIATVLTIMFGRGYFEEKGGNLATKQDVEDITKKVESVKIELQSQSSISAAKYQLKYDACLEALALIDAEFSYTLANPDKSKPTKQSTTIMEARACHSKLILSCENVEILKLFSEIMFGPQNSDDWRKPPTDLLNDFRNLIRKELGFGEELPLDRERAWFSKLTSDEHTSRLTITERRPDWSKGDMLEPQ